MSREEAIKGLEGLARNFGGYKPNEEMFDMAIAALKPTTWIPVDQDKYPEGYPEEFQPVWITDEYDRVYHMSYNGKRRIKAWMPFIVPEPYEAKNE